MIKNVAFKLFNIKMATITENHPNFIFNREP